MSRSLKSALLSGLVFPGAGHLYLKKYRRALVLVITTLVCLSLIIMETVDQAMMVLEQLEASGAAINTVNIIETSTRVANTTDTTTTYVSTIIIALCWFVGIVDSFRSGKQPK